MVQLAQRRFIGGEVAQPAPQIGEQLQQVGQFLQIKSEQNDASYLADKSSQYDLEAFDVYSQWQKDFSDNPTGGDGELRKRLNKLGNDLFRDAPSNNARNKAQLVTGSVIDSYRNKAQVWSSKQVIENIGVKSERTANNINMNALRQATPTAIPDLFTQVDASVAANSGVLPSSALEKQRSTMKRGVVVNTFEGMIKDGDPFVAQDELNSKKYDEYLEPDDVLSLQKKIDSKISKLEKVRVENIKETAKVSADRLRIDRVKEKLETGVGIFDPKNKEDKKAVDAVFDASGLSDALADNDLLAANETARLVKDTGIIPSGAKSFINSAMLTGNNQQIFFASDLIKRIEETNPLALELNGISKDISAKAGLVNKFKAAGVSEDNIVKFLDTQFNPQNKEILDNRKKDLRKLLEDDQVRGDITGMFETFLPFDEPDLQLAPNAAQGAITDYKRAYEGFYMLTGDSDVAEEKAEATIRGSYGVSRVAGRKEVVKNPPELFYGVEGSDNKWMVKQVKKDISDNLTFPIDDPEDPTYTVLADNITNREIALGQLPTYTLLVQRKDGVFDVLRNPSTNAIQRISFDNTQEKARIKEKQKKDQEERIASVKRRNKLKTTQEEVVEEIGFDDASLIGGTTFSGSLNDIRDVFVAAGDSLRTATNKAKDIMKSIEDGAEMLIEENIDLFEDIF